MLNAVKAFQVARCRCSSKVGIGLGTGKYTNGVRGINARGQFNRYNPIIAFNVGEKVVMYSNTYIARYQIQLLNPDIRNNGLQLIVGNNVWFNDASSGSLPANMNVIQYKLI